MNLRLMLETTARRYGEKTAVVMDEQRLSYAQLDEASNKVANALLGMGVKKGDRVAILLANSPEFVAIYFGAVKIGGVAVPLDTKYKLTELASLFRDSQPRVLVAESSLLAQVTPALGGFKSITGVIEIGSEYKHKGQYLGYREIMATGSPQPVTVELADEDTAHIAYTSGPSFNPRGVAMSHQALASEAAISGDGFQQTDKDIVVLFALPMHHAFALVVILMTAIAKGSTVVMLSGLSIHNLFETIERERATIFMAVPFVHALIVSAVETESLHHDLSSIRLWGTAGAAMPANTWQKIKQLLGFSAVDFWGMTESAAHVTCQPPDGSGKMGSVGKTLPGWELKIVDDNGRELSPNQPGEVVVRGPIMKGYYNNPQATAEVIKNGWLHTGDIGRVDEEGWLFLLASRKKDMLIAKGQNIYPSDIEQVLATHPKVAEVAVVGIPDKMRGELPRAFIRLKAGKAATEAAIKRALLRLKAGEAATEAAIKRALLRLKAGKAATEAAIKRFSLKHLANYKVPKEFIFTDSLPRTADGRIDKKSLRKKK